MTKFTFCGTETPVLYISYSVVDDQRHN